MEADFYGVASVQTEIMPIFLNASSVISAERLKELKVGYVFMEDGRRQLNGTSNQVR